MAVDIAYKANIGSITASSKRQENQCQLLGLFVELSMDNVGGRCVLEVSSDTSTPNMGDVVKVELDSGAGVKPVFNGEVESVTLTAYSMRIYANDGLVKLANLDIESAYEDVSAGFIVKDLLSQAGLTVGEVEDGPNFTSYVLHRGPRALRHIQTLSQLCGADLYTDGEGKAHFSVPKDGSADFTFSYGETVLEMDFKEVPLLFDGIEVVGEGAASSQGADKYFWLAKDLAGVSAKSSCDTDGNLNSGKKGKLSQLELNGSIRTGEDAQAVADAKMTALACRRLQGKLRVFATPGIEPGNLISIDELPEEHAAAKAIASGAVLRARSVRHELDRTQGFITSMEF